MLDLAALIKELPLPMLAPPDSMQAISQVRAQRQACRPRDATAANDEVARARQVIDSSYSIKGASEFTRPSSI